MQLCLLTALLLWIVSISWADDPIADTPLGKAKGYYLTSRGGRKFLGFSGLPYAKPPVGNLTFQAPEPVESWSGIRNATENGPLCIQYNILLNPPQAVGVTDCLYLSVYTQNVSGKAPVLVRFHGGGFMVGNGADSGPEYLMDEDIVIVNVNYRLGIYGFLSFEDEDMPGNNGMKDQVMSLHWVKKNIASFGGDPSKVTICGESAGAASVTHHIVSPLTKGLFHRAISESGSSYDTWPIQVPGVARTSAMDVLNACGCNYTTTKEALVCLRAKRPEEVLNICFKLEPTQYLALFVPVFESAGPNAFLTAPIKAWEHHPVPLLIGYTSGEGLMKSIAYVLTPTEIEKTFPTTAGYYLTASNPGKVTQAVHKFYFPKSDVITLNGWTNITNMHTDSLFGVGSQEMANMHNKNVYFYYFDYIGKYDDTRKYAKNDSWIVGPAHVAEMLYLWKRSPPLEGEDLTLSKNLISLWTNFIKYGNPTPKGSEVNWKTWTKEKTNYLYIDRNGGLNINEKLNADRYSFWKSVDYRDILDNYLSN